MKIWLLILGLTFLALAVLLIVIGFVIIMMARKKGVAVAPRPATTGPLPAPPTPVAPPQEWTPVVSQAPPSPAMPAPHVPPPVAAPAPPPAPSASLFERDVSPAVTEAIILPPPPDTDSTVLASVPLTERGMLVATTGRLSGQQFDLGPAGLVIGREKSMAQVVIEDPRVSKKHVWVGERDGVTMAVDQGSTNGTFLNTTDSPRIKEVALQSGDILIISDDVARFTFQH